jgi:hypothetical protein
MQTFDQALFDLYEANLITYEDALRNADSVNDLRLQIKLNKRARVQRPGGRHRAPDHHLNTMPNKTYDSVPPQRGLSRPGRDGLAHGRPSATRRPRGHRLQPHRAKAEAWVATYGGRTATPARRWPGPAWSSPAWATTTTCARWCWARRRLRRHERARSSSTTPPRPRWRASSAGARRRPALHRRAGLRRQAGAENGVLTVMCGGELAPSRP